MDTQNIRIEKMKFEHIEQIVAIEKACFGQNAWSGALFYSELLDGNKHYFVAVKNNSVIGYGGYAHILDEAHIMNIAVEGAYRKKGVSSSILTHLLQDARKRNIRAVTLEVREGNDAAISLYQKFGFKLEGVRKNYYEGKHNALIYWKIL